ncbi:MAG: dethiobiotin synthase, partial [Bacteroidia bacterium]
VTNKKSVFHPEAYQLQEPLSPHFAAKKEAIEINMSSIQLPKTNNTILIEGAGGILVPLNDSNNVIELAKQFECEIVIVIRNYLGCINHSLLTLEYLENNGYNLKGLVLNGDFEEEVLEPILKVANTKVLLSIPDKMDVNKATIIHYSKQVNW